MSTATATATSEPRRAGAAAIAGSPAARLASAIFEGTVRHRRLGENRPGAFEHRIALAYLDLDELPTLLGGRLVKPRPGLVRLRRRDLHGTGPLRAALETLVAQRSDRPAPGGPIRVLTGPRTLGTCFNPVSFYYCFTPEEELDTVVAEVTNTPWGDRHAYVLRRAGESPVLRGEHDKVLHVSPFQAMEHRHVWAVATPGETLSVHIENHRTDGNGARPPKDFDATLSLRRRELTPAALRRLVARQPGAAFRTLGLIYGHAIALKLRGAPHFRPPAKPTATTP